MWQKTNQGKFKEAQQDYENLIRIKGTRWLCVSVCGKDTSSKDTTDYEVSVFVCGKDTSSKDTTD